MPISPTSALANRAKRSKTPNQSANANRSDPFGSESPFDGIEPLSPSFFEASIQQEVSVHGRICQPLIPSMKALTVTHLQYLQSAFVPRKSEKPVVVKEVQPKVLFKLNQRRVLTEADLWRIVYYRFGAVDDFSCVERTIAEISKLVSIHPRTIQAFLARFVSDGHEVHLRRRFNGSKTPKISEELGKKLTSEKCLMKWAGWTLNGRVK